ncbi:hypothetical protein FPV16_05200 [Methylobacterium sp. W2]|uniref:hypothetical protein n=1 Tax=Methylobacterium sp. W2 TaxID=2598107 RepID=UPI001D0CA596|nr:hypothetical protein [Methylobacterium sp. W2]MCC0805625.1 hypothetical protein [Methylobacterium sp. W2]
MAQTGTGKCTKTGHFVPEGDRDTARTLVVIDGGEAVARKANAACGRPNAEFLTQLLVSCEPTMRASRAERMRSATARYAETTQIGTGRRRA